MRWIFDCDEVDRFADQFGEKAGDLGRRVIDSMPWPLVLPVGFLYLAILLVVVIPIWLPLGITCFPDRFARELKGQ